MMKNKEKDLLWPKHKFTHFIVLNIFKLWKKMYGRHFFIPSRWVII